MTKEKATVLLKSLLDGVDPVTGEVLPENHVCCTPQVMRALHEAILALGGGNQPEAAEHAPPVTKKGRLNAGRPWTDEDLDALKQMFTAGVSMEEICRVLQRRERGVKNTLAYLGLIGTPQAEEKHGQRRAGMPWTKADEELLIELYRQRASVETMAARLERSPYGVYCHMEKLELFSEEDGYPRHDELPKFTREEQDELRRLARDGWRVSEIAAHFGRPEESIAARLFYMGLSKEAPVHLKQESNA